MKIKAMRKSIKAKTVNDRSKRSLILLMAALMFVCAAVGASAETLQECHRVEMTYTDTKHDNKSVVRLWHADTAHPAVTEEINGIAEAWAAELGGDLPDAVNTGNKNSRLDVEIRYSRTGLTWLSFMVQARTTFHQQLVAQNFTTRTYDMNTAERVMLTDIFDDSDELWALLASRVRSTLQGYFPDQQANADVLDFVCSREQLEKADFTLHGMSLVLHYPAELLYEGRHTIMDVVFMYPEIRQYMTERGMTETDNLAYYKTCALTFDDGPARKNTPKVLDSLMKTGSVATFFILGNRIDENADLFQREHDEGHAQGSHNWHHGNVTKSSPSALRQMPAKCDAKFNKYIGTPTRYDRVPLGLYPNMISAKAGWPYIQWSVDTYDWRGRSTVNVMNTVKKQISDGDIILCHDIKDNTPESARQICEYLAENGYIMLTVDELFAKDGVELEPDKVYFRCTDGDTSIKK